MKEQNKVMTANRLGDGSVVYLAPDDAWTLKLGEADVARDEAAAERLEARAATAAARQEIVGPYLFGVAVSENGIAPVSQREIIRSGGPSVGTDLPATTPLR